MTIKVYSNFSKRRNSTKQPSSGTSVTATLKEGTSIENPVFLLSGNDFMINAVYAFNHYYFVDDIVSVRNNLIEVKCSMDVGATYKSDIGSYSAYIERAATSAAVDTFLPDPLVAMKNTERLLKATTSGAGVFNSTGVYVLSVLNTKGSGAGFTTYYMMDAPNVEYVAQYCNNNWGSAATDLLDWVQSVFLKTADSVIDCIWLPFSLAMTTGMSMVYESLEIGIDQISASGYRFKGNCVSSETITVSLPNTGYSDFRAGAPYTIGKLMIPCYGVVDFNPLDFPSGTITMKFNCDFATGDVACYLYNSTELVSSFTYNVAVPCPTGKITHDTAGTVSGVLGTAAGIAGAIGATGAAATAGSALATGASAVNTLAAAVAPSVSVRGAKGGRAIAYSGIDLVVTLICKETTDPAELLTHHGGLVMDKLTISGLSGYIQCSNADVPIAGTKSDKEAVNSLLNGGFYYE